MPDPSVPVLDVAEDILCCPKEEVTSLFGGRCYVGAERARALASTFRGPKAIFRPREEVESDGAVVQALPVVVVRNADGDVLRLRRREKTSDNPLHDKIVIWAGGHVRCEDADNGDPLVRCAIRELERNFGCRSKGRCCAASVRPTSQTATAPRSTSASSSSGSRKRTTSPRCSADPSSSREAAHR